MEISIDESEFLDSFKLLQDCKIDENNRRNLKIYVLNINANEFDYDLLSNRLIDPMIEYALSREVKRKYSNRPGTLSKKARNKFKDYTQNDGELGELLLFCFLEAQLKAPKILSKLELKTSTSLYVNGADGVHYLKKAENTYQLIFGESKMYKDIGVAFEKALKSINDFKNETNEKGESKSGINYEKGLISDNLSKETFSDEEKDFLEMIIYPKADGGFVVDDAFGIFIGFELEVSDEERNFDNAKFRETIYERVKIVVNNQIPKISNLIDRYNLKGYDFYIYVVPFTNIDLNRKKVLEDIVS